MADDREPALFLGDVPSHQGLGNFDIENDAARGAMDVIVTIGASVIPAGFIGEGELLDLAVLNEQVERAINRAVGDAGIATTDLLEHFTGGEVVLGVFDNVEHQSPLGGAAISPVRSFDCHRDRFAHHTITVENKSRYQPRLYHTHQVGIQTDTLDLFIVRRDEVKQWLEARERKRKLSGPSRRAQRLACFS
jgi:hypothetical protein